MLRPRRLRKKDGIQLFKDLLEKAYEPIEEFRIGKIMDELIYLSYRKSDQDIAVYNQALETEIKRVIDAAGDLNARWKTHLWVTKAGLNYDQRTKLLTATFGTWDFDQLMLKATQIFPDAKSLSVGAGKNRGSTTKRTTRKPQGGRARGRGLHGAWKR